MRVEQYLNCTLTESDDYLAFQGYGLFTTGANPKAPYCLLDEGTYEYHDSSDAGSLYIYNDVAAAMTVKYTNLSTGTTTTSTLPHTVNKIPYFLLGNKSVGNSIEVTRSSVVIANYTFNPVCESKYEVQNLDFVNKYGVWQRTPFFKASSKKW